MAALSMWGMIWICWENKEDGLEKYVFKTKEKAFFLIDEEVFIGLWNCNFSAAFLSHLENLVVKRGKCRLYLLLSTFVFWGSKSPSPRKFPDDGMEPFFIHLEVSFNSRAHVLDFQGVCFGDSLDYLGPPVCVGLLGQEIQRNRKYTPHGFIWLRHLPGNFTLKTLQNSRSTCNHFFLTFGKSKSGMKKHFAVSGARKEGNKAGKRIKIHTK